MEITTNINQINDLIEVIEFEIDCFRPIFFASNIPDDAAMKKAEEESDLDAIMKLERLRYYSQMVESQKDLINTTQDLQSIKNALIKTALEFREEIQKNIASHPFAPCGHSQIEPYNPCDHRFYEALKDGCPECDVTYSFECPRCENLDKGKYKDCTNCVIFIQPCDSKKCHQK